MTNILSVSFWGYSITQTIETVVHRCSSKWHSLKSGPETMGPDIQTPETGSLGLEACDPETENPESKTLRIELVRQIPCISNPHHRLN